jgi:hypothetical protein
MRHIKRTAIILEILILPLLITVSAVENEFPRTAVINNDQPRRDINGEIIDAHDGCLQFFDGQFYLYGTRYGNSDGFGNSNRYVCYSSPDLMHWTPHGEILKDAPPRLYFRPYVIFNKATRTYVLWYHADTYGVAISEHPEGPYTIRNPDIKVKWNVNTNAQIAVKENAGKVGDLGLFVDDDGTAYIAYVHARGHGMAFNGKNEPVPICQIGVEKLTPDYLGSTMQSSDLIGENCESPALFKRGSTYYLLFDNTCRFCTNGTGARVYTAKAPLGPYLYRGNINVQGQSASDVPASKTRLSKGRPNCIIKAQQTHVAVLPSRVGLVYLWMGDRWGSRPDGIKGHDFQYWSSPLRFDNDGMIKQLQWEDHWTMQLP